MQFLLIYKNIESQIPWAKETWTSREPLPSGQAFIPLLPLSDPFQSDAPKLFRLLPQISVFQHLSFVAVSAKGNTFPCYTWLVLPALCHNTVFFAQITWQLLHSGSHGGAENPASFRSHPASVLQLQLGSSIRTMCLPQRGSTTPLTSVSAGDACWLVSGCFYFNNPFPLQRLMI